jgi:esterase
MKLHYKTFGQGDPIIILHGLFGTLDNWQTIAKTLAENHSVYIVDQRNHGRSPHTDAMDYPSMAEDLKSFMESHWIYRSHIIGHSMGGKTAMQFALEHPDMVESLVVVDIAPKHYPGGHKEIFDALTALDLNSIDSRQEAEDFLQTRIPDFAVRQFLLKNLSRTKEGVYHWKMNLPVLYKHYAQILGPTLSDHSFDGETLFIKGGNSPYIQDEDLPDIRELFPRARVETVEGAGHWVHAEAPDAFVETVRKFIEG